MKKINNFFYSIYFKRFVKKLGKINFQKISKNKNKKNAEILVEFNSWSSGHIVLAIFLKALSKFFCNVEVIGYPGYLVDQEKIEQNFKNKIFWKIGNFFKIKTFGIYNFLKIEKIIWPEISLKEKKKSNRKALKILRNFKNLENLENLKIKNILIGDLIYDGFLKKFKVATVDFESKNFTDYFCESIVLFDYWIKYFNSREVVSVISFHGVYLCALPLRVAISKKIKTYVLSVEKIYFMTNKTFLPSQEHLFFKYQKNLIPREILKKGYDLAKRELKNKFSGKLHTSMIYITKSPYGKILNQKVLKKNDRIKILISPHALSDSPHALGKHFFPDYYQWIVDLLKISKNTYYDWYIKTHPNYNFYNDKTVEVIKSICSKSKIIYINPETSHLQIIKEGIDFVVTVHGNIGLEYPLFNVPVINASKNGPHKLCSFNINPVDKYDYRKILLNLKSLKRKKIKKIEIYEYYFMKYIYNNNNWLIKDFSIVLNSEDGIGSLNRPKIYEFFEKNYNETILKEKVAMIEKFIKKKSYSLCNNEINSNKDLFINKEI